MRAEGWSLRRIAVELGVSFSSVSVWVRDVPLPEPDVSTMAKDAPEDSTALPSGERRCSRCCWLLPLSNFNRLGDGHQWWCRPCFREYFRKRGELHLRQSGDAKRRRRDEARRFVLEYLTAHPCVDCGESDPVVLEFDHLGEKRGHVGTLVVEALGVKALREELSVCDVVCVNCHRRRTAERGGWLRANPNWRTATGPVLRPHAARNMKAAYAVLERSGCVDCGTRDVCVLEFDHVGEKRANVANLVNGGWSVERVMKEIHACEVRCCNCHRRRTAREKRHYRYRATTL